jgi:D-alanyl-D-alanine carboxypeptidase/D-alanyl-D-alanine-endopeptidase (penicillin-binding protein 4)
MKQITTLLLFLSLSVISIAQTRLQTAIEALISYEPMKYGSLSICVLDVETGQVIAQHNPNMSLVPASTMKAVTTATALGILGHSYTYKTKLEYDGKIKDGLLDGNIYIKGSGDPTLGSDQLDGVPSLEEVMVQMAGSIQKKGIKKIDGYVIGDGSIWGTAMPAANWQWNDIGNYYGVGAGGLNIHENMYYLFLKQKNTLGSTPDVARIVPKMSSLVIMNEIKSDKRGTGDNAYIFGAPYSMTRVLRGTIPVGNKEFRIKGAIPDPAQYTAYRLTEQLENNGISTKKIAKNIFEYRREGQDRYAIRQTLMTLTSPPLSKIVQRTNEKSVNLYAEALLKTMSKVKKSVGTTDKGVEVVKEFWEERGMDMKGFFMEDGSGLSPRNGVTSYQLSQIMRKVAKNKSIFEHFYPSLAIGGRTGTARYMFKKSKAAGNVRLKSGSMRRVRAYTGYAKTKSGKLVSFTIIANNFMGESRLIRTKMEKIMEGLVYLP